jgi:hypothetical protein
LTFWPALFVRPQDHVAHRQPQVEVLAVGTSKSPPAGRPRLIVQAERAQAILEERRKS